MSYFDRLVLGATFCEHVNRQLKGKLLLLLIDKLENSFPCRMLYFVNYSRGYALFGRLCRSTLPELVYFDKVKLKKGLGFFFYIVHDLLHLQK